MREESSNRQFIKVKNKRDAPAKEKTQINDCKKLVCEFGSHVHNRFIHNYIHYVYAPFHLAQQSRDY